MKKIISWASFAIIAMVLALLSLYCGASVANFLQELFNLEGWWCLLLAPIVLAVSSGVAIFFILRLQKFGRED